MKKQNKKAKLVVAKQTVRTLHGIELGRIVGGVGTSVGSNSHPYTCGCPEVAG